MLHWNLDNVNPWVVVTLILQLGMQLDIFFILKSHSHLKIGELKLVDLPILPWSSREYYIDHHMLWQSGMIVLKFVLLLQCLFMS